MSSTHYDLDKDLQISSDLNDFIIRKLSKDMRIK